jgi:AcrR family transcriptional regulator
MATSADTTKERLRGAAFGILREKGLAAASARGISAAAGVNQALIFYHFGTVAELIEEASNEAVDRSIAGYHDRFAQVRSLADLLEVGMRVHEEERRRGHVAVMAQLMAGAQHNPVLARASRYAVGLWTAQIREVLDRVLADTPAGELLDSADLAAAVSAGFVGIELLHGVDPRSAELAFASLERLNSLITTVNGLAPTTQAALRVAARRLGSRAVREAPSGGAQPENDAR